MEDVTQLTLKIGEFGGRLGSLEQSFQAERQSTRDGFREVGASLEEIKTMIQSRDNTDAGRSGFVKGAGWVAAGVAGLIFALGGSVAIVVKSWLGFPGAP